VGITKSWYSLYGPLCHNPTKKYPKVAKAALVGAAFAFPRKGSLDERDLPAKLYWSKRRAESLLSFSLDLVDLHAVANMLDETVDREENERSCETGAEVRRDDSAEFRRGEHAETSDDDERERLQEEGAHADSEEFEVYIWYCRHNFLFIR
jgi:hypothetical protein